MYCDIFEPKTNFFLFKVKKKNGLNCLLLDSWKNAFKMDLEDLHKSIAKKYQKDEIVCIRHSRAVSKALTIHPTFFLDHVSIVGFS